MMMRNVFLETFLSIFPYKLLPIWKLHCRPVLFLGLKIKSPLFTLPLIAVNFNPNLSSFVDIRQLNSATNRVVSLWKIAFTRNPAWNQLDNQDYSDFTFFLLVNGSTVCENTGMPSKNSF